MNQNFKEKKMDEFKSSFGKELSNRLEDRKLERALQVIFRKFESRTMQYLLFPLKALIKAPYEKIADRIIEMYFNENGIFNLAAEKIKSLDDEIQKYLLLLTEAKRNFESNKSFEPLLSQVKEALYWLVIFTNFGKRFAVYFLRWSFDQHIKAMEEYQKEELHIKLKNIATSYIALCEHLGISDKYKKRMRKYLQSAREKQVKSGIPSQYLILDEPKQLQSTVKKVGEISESEQYTLKVIKRKAEDEAVDSQNLISVHGGTIEDILALSGSWADKIEEIKLKLQRAYPENIKALEHAKQKIKNLLETGKLRDFANVSIENWTKVYEVLKLFESLSKNSKEYSGR